MLNYFWLSLTSMSKKYFVHVWTWGNVARIVFGLLLVWIWEYWSTSRLVLSPLLQMLLCTALLLGRDVQFSEQFETTKYMSTFSRFVWRCNFSQSVDMCHQWFFLPWLGLLLWICEKNEESMALMALVGNQKNRFILKLENAHMWSLQKNSSESIIPWWF